MNNFITEFVVSVFDWLSYTDELTDLDLSQRANKLEKAAAKWVSYSLTRPTFKKFWKELDRLYTIIANNDPEAYQVLNWFYSFLHTLGIHTITNNQDISKQIGLASIIIRQVMKRDYRVHPYPFDVTAHQLMGIIAEALVKRRHDSVYLDYDQKDYSINSIADYMECPYSYYLQYEAQIQPIEDDVNKLIETLVRNKFYNAEVQQNYTQLAIYSPNQRKEINKRVEQYMSALALVKFRITNRIKGRLQCHIGAYTVVYEDIDVSYNPENNCVTLITLFYGLKQDILMMFITKCLADELDQKIQIVRAIDVADTYENWSLVEYIIGSEHGYGIEEKLEESIVQIQQSIFMPIPERERCNQCRFRLLCADKHETGSMRSVYLYYIQTHEWHST